MRILLIVDGYSILDNVHNRRGDLRQASVFSARARQNRVRGLDLVGSGTHGVGAARRAYDTKTVVAAACGQSRFELSRVVAGGNTGNRDYSVANTSSVGQLDQQEFQRARRSEPSELRRR